MTKRLTCWACRLMVGMFTLLALQGVAASPATAGTSACESLGNGTRIGNAAIVLAQSVDGGSLTAADGTNLKDLPPFCRMFAVASTGPGSRILIEIWMPPADRWNGRLLGTGNGGEAGKIPTMDLVGGVRLGFATVTTDLGSYPAGLPGIGFNFGDGRPEAIRDWAFRATHEMTLLAKEVVTRYYGRAASKAYFEGCSTGGEQALMEAQRYPDDYDGIMAGDPAHNRTHLHIRFAALRQLGMRPGAGISSALMTVWTDAILKACGGRDGGAPGEKFLSDPLRCTISPRELLCRPGDAGGQCLTEKQVGALEKIYDGTRNPRTGELIYFGDVRGAEAQVLAVYGDTPLSRDFDVTHWILPPQRSAASFDFDRDMDALDNAYAADVNAMDPDLSRFATRGGKLIIYHGWADGLISPIDSIDYYQRISANGRQRSQFARLFMVPGMQHCFGGPGPNDFGQGPIVSGAPGATPDNDMLLALERWTDTGVAPEKIVAGPLRLPPPYSGLAPKSEEATRPICAFPSIPRYDGKGDPHLASSFACVAGTVPPYGRPAARYLR